ncbi:MAG TPA: DNA topoisomerase IB [Dermatophilaceae bacterium]|nr:DNA topoisomerase IB [Dermatophilaceae bacterium]
MRLRRSDLTRPGYHRVRRGAGFRYLDADGRAVPEVDRLRIAALAIPPAWREVWISPHPNGHIQAVGTDDAGRRQYLYHQQWRTDRDRVKHARALRLSRRLGAVRQAVSADLVRPRLDRRRVTAVALRMLDYGVFRVGGEAYLAEHGSHGVATLLRDHVRVRRGQVLFDFPAKGGLQRTVTFADEPLARAVTALRRARSGSERLLVFLGPHGWQELRADAVNETFKLLAGPAYSVKDLRTWQGTVVAAVAFAQVERPGSKAARTRAEREVMQTVAEELGNTPAVARRSYVDPVVVERFGQGRTIARTLRRLGYQRLPDLAQPRVRLPVEAAVARLLRD